MKKTKKIILTFIGLASIFFATIFISCTNDDDGNNETQNNSTSSGPTEPAATDPTEPAATDPAEPAATDPTDSTSFDVQTYTLGKKILYTDSGDEADGKEYDYEVIKNTFLTETSASADIVSRSSARAAASWETTNRYQNDDVMFAKVKEYTGVTEYLVIYEITQARDGAMTGVADLQDKYIFLNKVGKKMLTFAFRWSSNDILSSAEVAALKTSNTEYADMSDSDIKIAEWEKMTEEEIRARPPERFKILTTKNLSSDINKYLRIDVYYDRNDDGSVSYTDDKIKKVLKNHFIELNGEFVSPYKTTEYPNSSKNGTEYALLNKIGTFCKYASSTKDNKTTYEIRVTGDGTFTGEVASNETRTQIKNGKIFYKKGNEGVEIVTDKSYPFYRIEGSMELGESHESSGDGNGNETSNTTVTGGVTVEKQAEKNGSWTKLAEHIPFFFLGSEDADESVSEINFILSDIENTKEFTKAIQEEDQVRIKTIEVPNKISVGCPRYNGELAEYAYIDFTNPQFDEANEKITWTPDVEGFINKWIEAYKTFYSQN
ncbi:MAG: hypothetical protein K5873_06365 [Treponema sp.]|nr:hypothetical protein [Treponema sp.]